MRRPSWLLLALAAILVAAVVLGRDQQGPGEFGYLYREQTNAYIAWAGVAGIAYALGIALVRRCPARAMLPIILATGLVARLVVLVAPPLLSTDLYRYVWDGRVQAAGINPYRYIPNGPRTCHSSAMRRLGGKAGPTAIYPNINRVRLRPHHLSARRPGHCSPCIGLTCVRASGPIKATMLGFDILGATGLRIAAPPCRSPARPPTCVDLGLEPAADLGARRAAATSMRWRARLRRRWRCWLACYRRPAPGPAPPSPRSVAILTKLLPAALFPALWRRWDVAHPADRRRAAMHRGRLRCRTAGVPAWRVFGYLPGYADEEEQLQDGSKFHPVSRACACSSTLPALGERRLRHRSAWLILAALAALGRAAPSASRCGLHARADRDRARDALILGTAALIAILSPHYPWYLVMLVAPGGASLRPA